MYVLYFFYPINQTSKEAYRIMTLFKFHVENMLNALNTKKVVDEYCKQLWKEYKYIFLFFLTKIHYINIIHCCEE